MRPQHAEFHYVEALMAAAQRARRSHVRRIIRARFAGLCDVCGEAIAVGDSIAWRPNAAPTHRGCFAGETT